jgi:hypothetical protein
MMSVDEQIKLSNFSSIFSLEGKVAVVTGGSRGLGLHAASGYVSLYIQLGVGDGIESCDCFVTGCLLAGGDVNFGAPGL